MLFFFALITTFAFGSSTVFGKRVVNHLDFKMTTALRFGVTVILSLFVIIFFGNILIINNVNNIQWLYLAIIVFTRGALSIFIYYHGLKRVSVSMVAICELFWPFFAVLLDYILNYNVLNPVQIISSITLLIVFLFCD